MLIPEKPEGNQIKHTGAGVKKTVLLCSALGKYGIATLYFYIRH
tara:strand:+ start:256 stop:387 length:132 start_codon:yes stop_codon:yes gene_type:complete